METILILLQKPPSLDARRNRHYGGRLGVFPSRRLIVIIHRLHTSNEEHKSHPNITDKIKDPET